MLETKKRLLKFFVLVMVFSLAMPVAFAKPEKEKAEKTDKTKNEKIEKLKEFEKPSKEKSNAALYKEKIEKVSSDLNAVANEKKEKIKTENLKSEKKTNSQSNNDKSVEENELAGQEQDDVNIIEEVVEETEEEAEKTAEAIKAVESRNKFKKLLIGTDYKNLGQLRSSLAHNENQIRKLTRTVEQSQTEEEKTAIQEQLMTLTQERERIKNVISENEEGFSLLGWAFRLLNGYPADSIDEEEEDELLEEVAEVIEEEEVEEATKETVEEGTSTDNSSSVDETTTNQESSDQATTDQEIDSNVEANDQAVESDNEIVQ